MRKALKVLGVALASVLLAVLVAGVGLRAYYTDERLTQLIQDQLNKHLAGRFEIAAVRLHWPLHLEVERGVVKSPRGLPVLTLAGLTADIDAWPLLHGSLAISNVVIERPKVDVGVPQQGGEPPLAQALTPVPPQPNVTPDPIPLHIDFANVVIVDAELEVRQGDMRMRVENLELDDGSVWLGGDSVGGTVALHCKVVLQNQDPNSKMEMPLPNVHVQANEVVFQFATETPHVQVQKLIVASPGIDVEATGEVRFSESGVQNANAQARIALDTEEPKLRLNLPGDLNTHLRGKAELMVDFETAEGEHRLTADLHETRFEIYGMPVKGFHVDARYLPKSQQVQVRRVRLRLAQGELNLEGKMHVDMQPKFAAGEHTVTLKLRDFPVRALVGQFVGLPELLPEGLSLMVKSSGRSLLPPTSEVLIDLVPEGLPGEDWPGLPHSMELRGRFLTHPDLLEVLKLEVAVQHVPTFGIQGGLPMKQQSVLDLIQEIHKANPKGPLHRIPAAPATTKAL